MAPRTPATTETSTELSPIMQRISSTIGQMRQAPGEFDYEQMFAQIFEADSLDAALASADVVHLEDLIGTTLTIRGAKLSDSDFAASVIPVFAIMDVVLPDGREVVVTTGATQCIALLVKAQEANWWPIHVVATETQTSAGNRVFRFVKPQ